MNDREIEHLRMMAEEGDPDAIHRLRILEHRINTLPMELRRKEEEVHDQIDNIIDAYTPKKITEMLYYRLDKEKRVIKARQEIDRLDKEIQQSIDKMSFHRQPHLTMQERFKLEDEYKEIYLAPLSTLLAKKQKYIANKERAIAKEISGEIDQRNIELGHLFQMLLNLRRIAISKDIPVSNRTIERTSHNYHIYIRNRVYLSDSASAFAPFYEF